MILAFIGDGEGKTCAAMGHAVRAAGHGKKVAILQFLKGNDTTGEYLYFDCRGGSRPAPTFSDNIDIHLAGEKTFVFDKAPKDIHINKAKEGLAMANQMIASGKYFLVVLDEILDAVAAGLMTMGDLIDIVGAIHELPVRGSSPAPHLILTGRILPSEISTKIDLITRMQKIKHYYDRGEKGIEGLDW